MSLLDRFRAGSELDSVGHFTLDEKRAKNKMARFQLVRQEDFLLLIVQAAVAAGCLEIHLKLDAQTVQLFAPGTQLEEAKVGSLEDFLFDTRPESVPYYLLGVARNAITPFCLEEPTISISRDGLFMNAQPKEPLPDLQMHLEKYLVYCPCEVVVNDRPLARFELENDRLTTLSAGESSLLSLVRHGVVVGDKHLEFPVSFCGVVSNPSFRVDASFFDVVEDELYHQVLEEVKQEALELLAARARDYRPGDEGRTELLKQLGRGLPDPAGQALRECPLFTLADRQGCTSLNQLSLASSSEVLYSRQRLNLQLDIPVVLLDHAKVIEVLRELFPGTIKDAGGAYRQKLERLGHIEKWKNSPREVELGPGRYLMREKASGPDWQAEIGFLGPPGGESHVDMLYQGRLLCSERLEGVPPGATAVINFDEVEINESWSRPEGRRFRSIFSSLKEWIDRFFAGLVLKPEDLYPELVRYFDTLFMKESEELPLVALRAPLFRTVEGELLSFEQIKALDRVALGVSVSYSENLPPELLLPGTVVVYTARHKMLLAARLGESRVEDIREFQQRLSRLDQRLKHPSEPRLQVPVDLGRVVIEDDFEAELGLVFHRPGPLVRLVVMHRGAELETVEIKMTKVFRGEAVVQSKLLTPNKDWTGVERDAAYKALVKQLREMIREVEESALESSKLPQGQFLSLMHAYSRQLSEFEDKAILESTTPGKFHSLAELKTELEQHGEILRGPMGVSLSDRLVLLETSKERGVREGLMLNALGDFRWGDAGKLAEQRRLEAGFQARPVIKNLSAAPKAEFVLPLTSCRGEVAVGGLGSDTHVDCYYTGRYVCRKRGLLPQGCAGVVDSEELKLSEDFDQAEIPAAILDEMTALCEKGLLKCAVEHQRLDLRELAFRYALGNRASEAFQSAFAQLPVLQLQGGGTTSLKELSENDKSPGYVGHDFPNSIEPDRLVVRADKVELQLIRAKTDLQPYSCETRLTNLQKDRQYLAALSCDIPARLTFRREYSDDTGLSAEIALLPEASRILGLDKERNPLGLISVQCLPVYAVVGPARKGKRNEHQQPTASLTKSEIRWFQERVNDIYLSWIESLSFKQLTETDRSNALRILNYTKHELGSQSEHPQASLAQKLWRLPLFCCADGTWISGEALTSRFSAEDGPLVLSENRWRTPGHYPLIEPSSVEHNLLKAVFGEKSLQWYEAPPLVDTEQLKSNLQRLVSWGVSPLRAVRRKLEALAETLESEADEKPEPRKEKKKKKKKKKEAKPEPSPEEIFLQKMKSEAKALLGNKIFHGSDHYFTSTSIGNWLLGPPVYLTNGKCYLNRAHPDVRWLIQIDPNSASRQYRVARVLLLIHWVGLINIDSEEFTDEQEHRFLQDLVVRLVQTFS